MQTKIFDTSNFGRIHLPVPLFQLQGPERSEFSLACGAQVLDMPIKFPGTDYRLPESVRQWEGLINRLARFFPDVDERYAYFTVDQGTVRGNTHQRTPGLHVDGLQGARIWPKVVSDFSVVIVDSAPPIFYRQSFPVGYLRLDTHNLFLFFNRVSDPTKQVTWPAYTALWMNSYAVHGAGRMNTTHHRTFLRISWSVREFDRLGNTHNPLFDYSWAMVDRHVPTELRGG